MRGHIVDLKMLGKSKKQFTEWDEAIFLAAFQVFEDAIAQEPNIISRFRYKNGKENKLALKFKYVKTQKELHDKVVNAGKLLKWWMQYKKRYSGDYKVVINGENEQRDKLKELADILPILWD